MRTLVFLFFSFSFVAQAIPRTFYVGLTGARFTNSSSESFAGQTPVGLGVNYEYGINPHYGLGILLNVRQQTSIRQMTYGLQMTHQFTGFYYSYGLLTQALYRDGVASHATAHDTKLAVGYRMMGDFPVWAELAYNISKIYNFDQRVVRVDFFEIGVGTWVVWNP